MGEIIIVRKLIAFVRKPFEFVIVVAVVMAAVDIQMSVAVENAYVGVWEHGKDTERLHFHGIFYIPENAMIGTLEQVNDYDTRKHRKQTTFQNTHFLKQFGRNDFKEICKYEVKTTVRYLLKYIEKSGERLVYGGDLPEYVKCNILGEDVICPTGIDDKKVILFDDFTCIDGDGVVYGKATPEVLAQMPKAN